jgi:hypothetical protein
MYIIKVIKIAMEYNMENSLGCPHCKSKRMNKSGWRYSSKQLRQSYYCRDCHRITIKPLVSNETEAKLSEGTAPVSRKEIDGNTQF